MKDIVIVGMDGKHYLTIFFNVLKVIAETKRRKKRK
jgi:hypothetical protein